jgi:dTDP-4-amino-4,6-dideoxygalactose transaminase
MNVPYYKPSIGEQEIQEVVDCLRNGWLTTGPKAKLFEAEFARYVGRAHAVALSSCTAALHLALDAIGLTAGQTVVVPTLTFASTAEVVLYFGAKPLFVDCRPEDLNLNVADAAERIEAARARGEQVVAIMPVHYGGQLGDVAGVAALANRHGLKVIEDAAHCCPAYYRDSETEPWKPVGSLGEISCFSFYANKAITTGEGGMACTDHEKYANRMRLMSLHGISRDAWKRYTADGSWFYEILAPGYKYNMTDVAAAIGLHQLRKADHLHQQRARVAKLYSERLADIDELILPRELPNRIHSWHLYHVRLKLNKLSLDRGQFIAELKQAGIGASVHWMPLHMQPLYRERFGYRSADYPCAAAIYPQIVSLPIFPDMISEQVEYVCRTIQGIISRARVAVQGFDFDSVGAATPLREMQAAD